MHGRSRVLGKAEARRVCSQAAQKQAIRSSTALQAASGQQGMRWPQLSWRTHSRGSRQPVPTAGVQCARHRHLVNPMACSNSEPSPNYCADMEVLGCPCSGAPLPP